MKRKKKIDEGAVGSPWTSDLPPAPGDLKIVQAFVNTLDREKGREIANPRVLADWLARWRLLPAGTELTQADVERAIAVREDLRAVIHANTGAAVAAKVVERLDRVALKAPVCVRVGVGGATRFEPANGDLAGVFGRLLAIVAAARIEGLWPRFKLCDNDECRKAFYDRSPNLAARWCDKKRCGNRINARIFRRRHPGYFKDYNYR